MPPSAGQQKGNLTGKGREGEFKCRDCEIMGQMGNEKLLIQAMAIK
jgi:hypothetical protein